MEKKISINVGEAALPSSPTDDGGNEVMDVY